MTAHLERARGCLPARIPVAESGQARGRRLPFRVALGPCRAQITLTTTLQVTEVGCTPMRPLARRRTAVATTCVRLDRGIGRVARP